MASKVVGGSDPAKGSRRPDAVSVDALGARVKGTDWPRRRRRGESSAGRIRPTPVVRYVRFGSRTAPPPRRGS